MSIGLNTGNRVAGDPSTEFGNIIVENPQKHAIWVKRMLLNSIRVVFNSVLIKNTGAESIVLEVGSTDLEGKNAVGGIELSNVHVVQEQDIPTVKLTEVVPGALEGFFDLAGQITVSSPHGAKKTISPPIEDPKRITLKLNEELLTDE